MEPTNQIFPCLAKSERKLHVNNFMKVIIKKGIFYVKLVCELVSSSCNSQKTM